jgi:hypothetical protein
MIFMISTSKIRCPLVSPHDFRYLHPPTHPPLQCEVKTQQNANAPCSLAEPSLSAVLWADVLFSLVLLLVTGKNMAGDG